MLDKLIKDFAATRNHQEITNHLYVDVTGQIRIGRGVKISLEQAKTLPFFLKDRPAQLASPEQIEREYRLLSDLFHREFPESFIPHTSLFLKRKILNRLEIRDITHLVERFSNKLPNFQLLPHKAKLKLLELTDTFDEFIFDGKMRVPNQLYILTPYQVALYTGALHHSRDFQTQSKLSTSSHHNEVSFPDISRYKNMDNFLDGIILYNDSNINTMAELVCECLSHNHYSFSQFFSNYSKMVKKSQFLFKINARDLRLAYLKHDFVKPVFKFGVDGFGKLGYVCDAYAKLAQRFYDQQKEDIGTRVVGFATETLELAARWYTESKVYLSIVRMMAIAGVTNPIALACVATVGTIMYSNYLWDGSWDFGNKLLSQLAPFCYASQDVNYALSVGSTTNSPQVIHMPTSLQQLSQHLLMFNYPALISASNNQAIPFSYCPLFKDTLPITSTLLIDMPNFNNNNSPTFGVDQRFPQVQPFNIIRDINNLMIGEKLFPEALPKEPRGNVALWTDNHGRINWQVNVNDPLLAAPLIGAMFLLGKIKEGRLSEKEKAIKKVSDCFASLARAQQKSFHFDNFTFKKWPELVAQRRQKLNEALNWAAKAYKDVPAVLLDILATRHALKVDKESLLKDWPLNLKQIRYEYFENFQLLSNEFYRYYQNDLTKAYKISKEMVVDFSIFSDSYLARALVLENINPDRAKKLINKAVSIEREKIKATVQITEEMYSNLYWLENQKLDLFYRTFQNAGVKTKDRHAKELYELAATFETCLSALTYQVFICDYQNNFSQAIEHQKKLCDFMDTLENSFKLASLYFKNNDKLNTIISLKHCVDKMSKGYYLDSKTKEKISCTKSELFIAAIRHLQDKDPQDAIEYFISCKQLNPPQEIISIIREVEDQIQHYNDEREQEIQRYNNAVKRQRRLQICRHAINISEIGINLYFIWEYYKLATRLKNMKICLPMPDTTSLQLYSSVLCFPRHDFTTIQEKQLNHQGSDLTLITEEQPDQNDESHHNERNQESQVSTLFINHETVDVEHSTSTDLQKAEQKLSQMCVSNQGEPYQLNKNCRRSHMLTDFFSFGGSNTEYSSDTDLQNAERKLNQLCTFNQDERHQLNSHLQQSLAVTEFFSSRTFGAEHTFSRDWRNTEQRSNKLDL